MRKIIFTILAVSISMYGIAQEGVRLQSQNHYVTAPFDTPIKPYSASSKRTVSGWHNFVNSAIDWGATFTQITNNSLFPDTTVLQLYGDGQGGVTLGNAGLHSVGSVLDLQSDAFAENFTRFTIYTLDSIAIPYHYAYNVPGSVDTLVIQIFNHGRIQRGTLDGGGIFASVPYSRANNKGTTPTHEFTVLLTENDSFWRRNLSGGAGVLSLGIPGGPMQVPAGGIVAFTVSYIPGFSYDLGDTLQHDYDPEPVKKLNHFKVIMMQDAGKTFSDYNMALTANYQVRYGAGWGGRYIPGSAWTTQTSYLYSHFHITATNVSIDDKQAITGISTFPNPVKSSDNLNIAFNLENHENVNMVLFNILGQKVADLTNENYSAGKHNVNFNTSGLKSGIYFLNIKAGNSTQTQKIHIVE